MEVEVLIDEMTRGKVGFRFDGRLFEWQIEQLMPEQGLPDLVVYYPLVIEVKADCTRHDVQRDEWERLLEALIKGLKAHNLTPEIER